MTKDIELPFRELKSDKLPRCHLHFAPTKHTVWQSEAVHFYQKQYYKMKKPKLEIAKARYINRS